MSHMLFRSTSHETVVLQSLPAVYRCTRMPQCPQDVV